MKTPKQDWPKKVTVGNATVTVYKRITGSGNVGFMIAYWTNRQAQICIVQLGNRSNETRRKKAGTLSTFGARVAGTSGNDIAEFVRLGDALKPFAVSISDVVTRAATWLSKLGTLDAVDRAITSGPAVSREPHTVESAVTEFLALKKTNGASSAYNNSLKSILKKFKTAFVCDIATVSTATIQSWLDNQQLHPGTYNNIRMAIHTLFNHCVRRAYIEKNPVVGVDVRKERGTNTEFLPRQNCKSFCSPHRMECRRVWQSPLSVACARRSFPGSLGATWILTAGISSSTLAKPKLYRAE